MEPLSAEILTEAETKDIRGAVRRRLRLRASAHASGNVRTAMILNISETGLLIETSLSLEVGDTLHVEIPEASPSTALVVWTKGSRAGCTFVSPISRGAVSAARLKSDVEAAHSTYGSHEAKHEVLAFWNAAPCGERLHLLAMTPEGYQAQADTRRRLDPIIDSVARFPETAGLDVLEVGIGLGADHQRFAEAGAHLTGIDFSPVAVAHTRRRLEQLGLPFNLHVADAEKLPFRDASFDMVYSWGVIHHTPDTAAAASEILRVLRPGGRYAVMVYHRFSLVGAMLWLRYGLLGGLSLDEVYARYLESPGTKAFTRREAQALFPGSRVTVALGSGDLLEGGAGQRHGGILLNMVRAIWPRWLVRPLARPLGLLLIIEGSVQRQRG